MPHGGRRRLRQPAGSPPGAEAGSVASGLQADGPLPAQRSPLRSRGWRAASGPMESPRPPGRRASGPPPRLRSYPRPSATGHLRTDAAASVRQPGGHFWAGSRFRPSAVGRPPARRPSVAVQVRNRLVIPEAGGDCISPEAARRPGSRKRLRQPSSRHRPSAVGRWVVSEPPGSHLRLRRPEGGHLAGNPQAAVPVRKRPAGWRQKAPARRRPAGWRQDAPARRRPGGPEARGGRAGPESVHRPGGRKQLRLS